MLRTMLKSKIHRVRVTQADLYYEGSITIDENLMELADLLPFEKVTVVNNNNGERLETYVIKGKRNTGVICLNGAAARKAVPGDEVIILSYMRVENEEIEKYKPRLVFVDQFNNPIQKEDYKEIKINPFATSEVNN